MHTSRLRIRLRSLLLAFTVALLGASFVAMPNAAEAAKSKASTKKRAKKPSKAELKRIAAQRAARAAALARARQDAKEAALHSQRASLHAGTQPVVDESLQLISNIVLVEHQRTGAHVVEKNVDTPVAIASITKLMTAMVTLDAKQDLLEPLTISDDDIDTEKGSRSRLSVGTVHARATFLQLALMSSENRAASALARGFPGGRAAFVEAMNAKAKLIGMERARFVDSTGLSSQNVASASDLAKLVRAAYEYPLIRRYSTADGLQVEAGGKVRNYVNTNRLTHTEGWNIGLSKTGFINEAGRCLVMQTYVEGQPLIFVLLDSYGKNSRIGDAARIKTWLEERNGKKTLSQAPSSATSASAASRQSGRS